MSKNKQKIRSQQQLLKKRIFKTWKNPHCQYCGNPNKDILQLHHIKPICNGGDNDINNIILLCPNCHKMVHTKQIEEQELVEIKKTPKIFTKNQNYKFEVEKLKRNESKLKLSIHKKDEDAKKIKMQLCHYIDRMEYKYSNLLEENKRLLKENENLKQMQILKIQTFINGLFSLRFCKRMFRF